MASSANNLNNSESGVSFSADTFFNRVSILIETWKEVRNFVIYHLYILLKRGSQMISMLWSYQMEKMKRVRSKSKLMRCSKISHFSLPNPINFQSFWLFEIEFTDSLIVFTKQTVLFIFGQKKRIFFFFLKKPILQWIYWPIIKPNSRPQNTNWSF